MRKLSVLILCFAVLFCSCTVSFQETPTDITTTTASQELPEVDFSDQNKYTVDCFGDGFTKSSITSYTHWLGTMLGYNWTVNNYGARDDTVLGICARQGCIPAVIEPVTIPNENNYTDCNIVSSYKGRALPKMLINTSEGFNPVTIGNDLFSITNVSVDDETSEYSIRPITAVMEPTVIDETTKILSNYAVNNDYNSIIIVMMGSDQTYESIEELVEFNKKMVAGYERYIVISEPYAIRGNDRADYDKLMLDAFGANYLNAREYIIRNGLSDLGIEPTETDLERIKNGYTPSSLMTGKYYNEDGNKVLAQCIFNKGVELGYWS